MSVINISTVGSPTASMTLVKSTAVQSNLIARLFVIARNTFREAVRDRVLYSLVLFALLLVGAAILLGDLTNGQEARTTVNIGLSGILLFGAFIAVFVGVGLVSKEIEKRTVFAIFAKPVGRAEFLVGKYLGLCLTLTVNVALMGSAVMLALLYLGGGNLIAPCWAAIYLLLLQLLVITAIALLFSSFTSPNLSALLTLFVVIAGHFSTSLRDFAKLTDTVAIKYFFEFLYYVLPNFAHFTVNTLAANGKTQSFAYMSGATLYALAYISVLLTITTIVFSRRNFK